MKFATHGQRNNEVCVFDLGLTELLTYYIDHKAIWCTPCTAFPCEEEQQSGLCPTFSIQWSDHELPCLLIIRERERDAC